MNFYLLIIGFIYAVPVFGSDLYSNELCGVSSSKQRPCHYVKELNFHLDSNLAEEESFNTYSNYLIGRVAEMNNTFSSFNVNVKFKPSPKGAWFSKPKEKDSNIELTFLLSETIDKKFIIITFYSFSRGPFYIKTSQCSSSENDCVIKEIGKLIDEIVVKSITHNGS